MGGIKTGATGVSGAGAVVGLGVLGSFSDENLLLWPSFLFWRR